MLTVTKNKPLATTTTGSLPRPNWCTENLNGRSLSTALSEVTFHEHYTDAVATYLSDQIRAGLDIVTDGDARFDSLVAGRSWASYVTERLQGIGPEQLLTQIWTSPREKTPGDIFHEVSEARLSAKVVGEIGRGTLEYARCWKVAQRMTHKPMKFGCCSGQLIEVLLVNEHYPSREALVGALSKTLNQEYHELADAGCPVIQVEEPMIHHMAAAPHGPMDAAFYVRALNEEIAGLRKKTEVWVHTCFGSPAAQRVDDHADYGPALPYLNELDADVITFETAADDGAAFEAIGKKISKDKHICIGVVNHRKLQVETAEQVAALIRKAIRHIEPERLIVGTDCGFGRQGMSRMHAFYKMVAIVQGANIVKRELGLPESPCLAADARYSLR